MSRLPAHGSGSPGGWTESTEGDLDQDLTEEAGARLEDWDAPAGSGRAASAVRAVAAVLVIAILGVALAQAVLAR